MTDLKNIVFLVILLHHSIGVCGQEKSTEQSNKFSSTIFISGAYDHATNRWAIPSLTYDLGWSMTRALSSHLSISYTQWHANDRLMIPIEIGPSVSILQNNSWRISALFAAGPTLMVGNDYAGFFAHGRGGLKISRIAKNGHDIAWQFSFSEAMAFHPSHFSYFTTSIGYKL